MLKSRVSTVSRLSSLKLFFEMFSNFSNLNLYQSYMKTWGGGSGAMTPRFLTSVLDGDEWSASCSGRFIPAIHCAGDWAPEPV